MRFCSTPESAADGEITVLATIETLLAIFFSLVCVKLFDTAAHIVVGALVAPFLFLRTEASTLKAFQMFDLCAQRLMGPVAFVSGLYERLPARLRSFIFLFVLLPLFASAVAIMKFIANVQTLISTPREVLAAIPGNWLRLTLATDYKHPPELLPGIEKGTDVPTSVQCFRYAEVRQKIISSGADAALSRKLSLLAIYGSTILYRLFIKSTALVYFPLIWIGQVPMTVKGILSLPLERVRRWYAYALLLITLSPLLISFHLQDTLATPQDRVIYAYVMPVGKIDWWHISRVIAVMVTIALYFYARNLHDDSPEHAERERMIITTANRLRAACGVFTMGCFVLIVLML